MSKLNFTIAFLALFIFAGISLSSEPTTARESNEDAWGKGHGPVQVRIKEIAKTDSVVELKGLIRSKQQNLEIEWILPEGAALIGGDTTKSASRASDGSYGDLTIKVDISNAKKEPIVFMAFFLQNGERNGHSRAYSWNENKKDKERVEKIRAKMKARKADYMH